MTVTVSPGASPEISKLHHPKGASELAGREAKGTAWVANESIVPEPEVIVMSPVATVAVEELVAWVVVEPPACPGAGPVPGLGRAVVLLEVWLRLTAMVVVATEETLVEAEVSAADAVLLAAGGGAALVDSPEDALAELELDVTVSAGCSPGGWVVVRVLWLRPCAAKGVPPIVDEAGPPMGAGRYKRKRLTPDATRRNPSTTVTTEERDKEAQRSAILPI